MRAVRPHTFEADDLIEADGAAALWRRGEALFVDTRSADAFQAARVPGAVSVPLEQIARRMRDLPAGAQVITYCT